MEKNTFLILNDIIYDLYTWDSIQQIQENFFQRLKLIIPFSYASILMRDESVKDSIQLSSPICYPEYFTEAEEEYLRSADEDYLLWILHTRESKLVCESSILDEERRLNSPLYLHCYQKYDIYDSMQYSIVYNQTFLGVLTLFRTQADGVFTSDDMFYLRSLGMHLNVVIDKLRHPQHIKKSASSSMEDLIKHFSLTHRESQVLSELYSFKGNDEILESLGISDSTLQKHLQNIFRKMNVSSKWELLQYHPSISFT